jgi:reactive intermediate/imine deaminase
MNPQTRRAFLSKVSVAPAAAVVGAATIARAHNESLRKIVPGSPSPNFSRAVIFGDLAFISGVLGTKAGLRELASPDFEGQCKQALENLKASVEAARSSMSQVLKCTCYLTDASDFDTMNKVYRTFFPNDPPARSTVGVKELVLAGAKFEIDCVTTLA